MTRIEEDEAHMQAALSLAERGLGEVWPNPAVGCVLVGKEGYVVGRGRTQKGGRPHAETMAILSAGKAAFGATAYVTLEPCSHQGKTAPCADALIEAGIKRCVIALEDPDPRVSGAGMERLRQAGIAVDVGCLEEAAKELNRGYLTLQKKGRPMVALKLATTQDGKIATSKGKSQWITGSLARDYGHWLRATHDAILVGSGTILADDPELTCRLHGLERRSPLRIVLDREGRLSEKARIVQYTTFAESWILTSEKGKKTLNKKINENVKLIEIKELYDQSIGLAVCLSLLGKKGITRLLIEGGSKIATAFLKAGLVDRLYWFRSNGIMGNDGLPAIGDLDLAELASMPTLIRREMRSLGKDILELFDFKI